MMDSHYNTLRNTAHNYRECSNNGECNRKTGECECLEGFWGSSCERMHCPGYTGDKLNYYYECSGHGECLNIQKITKNDYGNVYELWDKKISYGCLCDYGYYGGMCEERHCKKGIDPKYIDDVQTLKLPIYNLGIFTTSPTMDFNDGFAQPHDAYLKVRFFDQLNKPWLTSPLKAGFSCNDLVNALEQLPNKVIPLNSIKCVKTHITYGNPTIDSDLLQFKYDYNSRYIYMSNSPKAESFQYKPTFWDAGFRNSYDKNMVGNITGDIYHLEFPNNPGLMLPLEIETFINNDNTASMVSKGTTIFRSWTDGQQGENIDYFANHCKGVNVQIDHVGSIYFLTGLSSIEKSKLKVCLGGSDHNDKNNVEIYNWDYGTTTYPHFIRLLKSVTDSNDGGYYVALIYDTTIFLDNLGTEGTFRFLHPFKLDYLYNPELTIFEVYTTHSVLQLTSLNSQVTFDFASNMLFTTNTTNTGSYKWHGDMSCEKTIPSDTTTNDHNKLSYIDLCLKKNDIIILLDPLNTMYNPSYLNMYTIKRLYTIPLYETFGDTQYEKFFANPITGGKNILSQSKSTVRSFFPSYYTSSTNNADVTNVNTNITNRVTICENEIFKADGCTNSTNSAGTSVLGLYLTSTMATQLATITTCSNTQKVITFTKTTLGCSQYTVALGCAANTACSGTITYTITKVPGKAAKLYSNDNYRANVILTDLTTNWATSITGAAQTRIYKFFPNDKSTYSYVTECANRGICNTYDGICDCFHGYTGDACTEIHSMAV